MRVEINGQLYDKGQIENALRCSSGLVTAYARASEANGGGSEVEWEDVDFAHERALRVFSESTIDALNYQAKLDNGFV